MPLRSAFSRSVGTLVLLAVLAPAATSLAWSHQGHILVTRMACLRIIDDPAAPADLKAFLKKHMKYDLAACEKLVISEHVGITAENYLAGLDGAATLPDRIQETPEGRSTMIEPYGMPEMKMHYLDLEFFSKAGAYKDDLSGRPAIADVPRDPRDPRYRQAGFLPFRVEESYTNLVKALGAKDKPVEDTEATRWLGYLAHYMADAHQPHHGTVDFKSLSYLAGKVDGVRAVKTKLSDSTEATTYRVDRDKSRLINPHGAVEFELFEDTQAPRAQLRKDFWTLLTKNLAAMDAPKPVDAPILKDRFEWTLKTLDFSYGYLPLIGGAAQKAYAGGKFDPDAFFTYKKQVTLGGATRESTILEMIAAQKALAITEVERALRAAWAEAKK